MHLARSPYTKTPMQLLVEKRTIVYRNTKIEIDFHVYKCPDSGDLFEDEKLAERNYYAVLNKWKHTKA